MAERTIRHLSFRYTGEDGVERHAFRGETVDLSPEAIEFGDRIGAFTTAEDQVTEDGTLEVFDPATASDEQLDGWFAGSKPTVQDVVDAAGGDPDVAQRLLDAESRYQDGDSRKGVVEGLAAVIGQAQ